MVVLLVCVALAATLDHSHTTLSPNKLYDANIMPENYDPECGGGKQEEADPVELGWADVSSTK